MQLCERLHALPLPGGLLDQPWGFMLRMRTLVGYAHDFATYEAQGDNAPAAVRSRVLAVGARTVGRTN